MDMNAGFEIQTAGIKDLMPLRRLEKICFPVDAWPLLDMIGALTFPDVVRFKAADNGVLVAFIAGDIRRSTQTGWIATICVHPDYRRRGLAKELLALCEAEMNMPRVRLTVRESNTAAIELYRNQGYLEVGRWEKYYKGNEDGIVMEKFGL
jgi:ribosomal-protein-alanine N-acetyltransferase